MKAFSKEFNHLKCQNQLYESLTFIFVKEKDCIWLFEQAFEWYSNHEKEFPFELFTSIKPIESDDNQETVVSRKLALEQFKEWFLKDGTV